MLAWKTSMKDDVEEQKKCTKSNPTAKQPHCFYNTTHFICSSPHHPEHKAIHYNHKQFLWLNQTNPLVPASQAESRNTPDRWPVKSYTQIKISQYAIN